MSTHLFSLNYISNIERNVKDTLLVDHVKWIDLFYIKILSCRRFVKRERKKILTNKLITGMKENGR